MGTLGPCSQCMRACEAIATWRSLPLEKGRSPVLPLAGRRPEPGNQERGANSPLQETMRREAIRACTLHGNPQRGPGRPWNDEGIDRIADNTESPTPDTQKT